jgi:hypothetical protein
LLPGIAALMAGFVFVNATGDLQYEGDPEFEFTSEGVIAKTKDKVLAYDARVRRFAPKAEGFASAVVHDLPAIGVLLELGNSDESFFARDCGDRTLVRWLASDADPEPSEVDVDFRGAVLLDGRPVAVVLEWHPPGDPENRCGRPEPRLLHRGSSAAGVPAHKLEAVWAEAGGKKDKLDDFLDGRLLVEGVELQLANDPVGLVPGAESVELSRWLPVALSGGFEIVGGVAEIAGAVYVWGYRKLVRSLGPYRTVCEWDIGGNVRDVVAVGSRAVAILDYGIAISDRDGGAFLPAESGGCAVLETPPPRTIVPLENDEDRALLVTRDGVFELDLVNRTWRQAEGVEEPGTLTYLEDHGRGLPLAGDPFIFYNESRHFRISPDPTGGVVAVAACRHDRGELHRAGKPADSTVLDTPVGTLIAVGGGLFALELPGADADCEIGPLGPAGPLGAMWDRLGVVHDIHVNSRGSVGEELVFVATSNGIEVLERGLQFLLYPMADPRDSSALLAIPLLLGLALPTAFGLWGILFRARNVWPGRPLGFVSYRRADSECEAQLVHERLAAQLAPVPLFIDRAGIEGGEHFAETIERALSACRVLLVMIGPRWLDIRGEDGTRRLDDPSDLVVREIEVALERGIPVLPVLIGGASMPAEADLPPRIAALAARHAEVHNLGDTESGRRAAENLARRVRQVTGLWPRGVF